MSHDAKIKQALDKLSAIDSDIAHSIAHYGYPQDRSMPQSFESLAKIIIGQQISRQAATSLWHKVTDAYDMTAPIISALPVTALTSCGISGRKSEYLIGLAKAIATKELSLDSLAALSGEEVQKRLISLRGIGAWTADNYRLFALGDMDAWPGNDIALQEAMKRLKRLDKRPNMAEMIALAESWRPYRGAGALFLWHLYGIEVRQAAPVSI